MDMVERLRPEIIVLDLTMPGMSGFDIAEEITHNTDLRPKPLIAVTADGSESSREKTAQHGFDRHFVKPIGAEEQIRRRLDLDGKMQLFDRAKRLARKHCILI
jgi:CheY-like chemotaxis protein